MTKSKQLNPIRIPLSVQRDIILENDKLFAKDVTALAAHRARTGEVGNEGAINAWQVAAALRRAGVPFRLAKKMVRA